MVVLRQKTRKRFGQHWLTDRSVLNKIIEAADLRVNDRILEIGPGCGALTEYLVESKANLIHAIELDRDLVDGLRKRFFDQKNFSLQEGDFLSVEVKPSDGMPLNKVVANIPYNITSPLLEKLLGNLGKRPEKSYERLVLLMQKEVADRIIALPGQKNFSAMSVRLQLIASAKGICDVPPKCFKPSPKVNSKVVVIEPLPFKDRHDFLIEKRVNFLLKMAFSARRKKLRNTLRGVKPLSDLERLTERLGINLDQRPQELSPIMWVQLAKLLK